MHPGGRPPMYETPEQLQKKVDEYFVYVKGETETRPSSTVFQGHVFTKREPEPVTISGLAYYLGFESRQSFYDYEQKPEFSYIIRKTRLFIESMYEGRLQGNNPTGAIFWLKNAGWKDKQEVEQTGGITIKYQAPGDYIYPAQDQSDSGIPESI
jgi:hypothetical protein